MQHSPHFEDWLELQKLKRENEELKMAKIKNPNNIKQAEEHLRQLRKMGYAVVAFTPQELRGVDPLKFESRLSELGWKTIEIMVNGPEDRLSVKDWDNAPLDDDWHWAIK